MQIQLNYEMALLLFYLLVTGKKRVESLYDFQMICHLHSVTECLQTVTYSVTECK